MSKRVHEFDDTHVPLRRRRRDTRIYHDFSTLPVEVSDLILQKLDIPSLTAVRNTGRTFATVGRRYLRRKGCFGQAMFTAPMRGLASALIDATTESQAGAGAVLKQYLIYLEPVYDSRDSRLQGWTDKLGMVELTLDSHRPGLVSVQTAGQPLRTGTLQPVGNEDIATYSAWLQQAVHCHIAHKHASTMGVPKNIVCAVLPFSDQSTGTRHRSCRVVQLGNPEETLLPFFDTLRQQVMRANDDLFEDDDVNVEGNPDAAGVYRFDPPMNEDNDEDEVDDAQERAATQAHKFTDTSLQDVLRQTIWLLMYLYMVPMNNGIRRLWALNNIVDSLSVAFMVGMDSERVTLGPAPRFGYTQARITNFDAAFIEMSFGRVIGGSPRIYYRSSIALDVSTLLAHVHHILRDTTLFPVTRRVLETLNIARLYDVEDYGQTLRIKPMTDDMLVSVEWEFSTTDFPVGFHADEFGLDE